MPEERIRPSTGQQALRGIGYVTAAALAVGAVGYLIALVVSWIY